MLLGYCLKPFLITIKNSDFVRENNMSRKPLKINWLSAHLSFSKDYGSSSVLCARLLRKICIALWLTQKCYLHPPMEFLQHMHHMSFLCKSVFQALEHNYRRQCLWSSEKLWRCYFWDPESLAEEGMSVPWQGCHADCSQGMGLKVLSAFQTQTEVT